MMTRSALELPRDLAYPPTRGWSVSDRSGAFADDAEAVAALAILCRLVCAGGDPSVAADDGSGWVDYELGLSDGATAAEIVADVSARLAGPRSPRTEAPVRITPQVARDGILELELDGKTGGRLWVRDRSAAEADHLAAMLRAVTADCRADRRLCDISASPADGDYRLPETSIGPDAALPRESIAALIGRIARATPERSAVVGREVTLSCRDLDELANGLAHDLLDAGIGRGHRVELRFDRGPAFVVAALGCLRAGAAYVPVDPAYPRERRRQLSTLAAASVTIYGAEQAGDGDGNRWMLDLGPCRREPLAPDVEVGVDDVAYVIFTSGSTGAPKGAQIRHEGLQNLVTTSRRMLAGARPRTLAFASPSFDVSVWEVFVTLALGGTVVPYESPLTTPGDLSARVRASDVDTIFLLSSVLNELDPSAFSVVHTVVTGGELYNQELVDRWAPGRSMFYVYGPTEATVFQSWYRCRSGQEWPPPPTIGQPMENTTFRVVDRRGRTAPAGVTGELWIGGAGVGAGYLGADESRDERFSVEPSPPGAWVYRTGDLARQRSDGDIDFIGRADHQVKVGGHRVNLGEIETAMLTSLPLDTAVTVVESSGGANRLVGYYKARVGHDLSADDVRRTLSELLPRHMVPSTLVELGEVPRLTSGKIDRARLPAVGTGRSVPPATDLEAAVLDIFRGVEPVVDGVADDLFAAGGTSMGAMTIIAQIHVRFGVLVELHELMGDCSARRVARMVESCASPAPAPSISPSALLGEWTASPLQSQMYVLDAIRHPEIPLYNVPAVYQLNGPVDVARLLAAADRTLARHDVLRSRFEWRGDELRQIVGQRAPVTELIELGDDAEVGDRIDRELRTPLLPGDGPLVRAWFVTGAEDRRFVLNAHHCLCDGIALGLLVDQVLDAYDNEAGDEDGPQIGFEEWISFTDERDRTTDNEHWLAALTPNPSPLVLPIDHDRPPDRSGRGDVVVRRLDPDLVNRLRTFARAERTSLFVTITGAVRLLLYDECGQDDIVIGTAMAGRDPAALFSDVVGCLVNPVALRSPISGTDTLTDVVARERRVVGQASAHQYLPLSDIVARLGLPPSVQRHPLYDVWVAVQLPAPVDRVTRDGVRVSGGPVPLPISLLDLSFQFVEQANRSVDVRLQFDADLYDRITIERLIDRLFVLADAALRSPGASVDTLITATGGRADEDIIRFTLARSGETPGRGAAAIDDPPGKS